MKISLVQLILLGIPESISILTLAFVVANGELKWKKIFVLGSILATSVFLMRLLPITFGVHTIIYIGILILIIKEQVKIDVVPAIIYSLVITLVLILSETLTATILIFLLQISPEMLKEDILLYLLVSYPHVLIIFGLAILFYKYKRKGKNELFKNQ